MKVKMNVLILLMVTFSVAPLPAQLNDGRTGEANKWLRSVIEHRMDKNSRFKHSHISPMAALDRATWKSKPGQAIHVMEYKAGLRFSHQPGKDIQLTLRQKGEKWFWETTLKDVTCNYKKKPVPSGGEVKSGAEIRRGVWCLSIYISKDEFIIVMYNQNAAMFKRFEKLLYYPPNKAYAVQATFEKYPKAEPVEMATSRNLKKTFYRYGRVKFKLDGKEYQLSAYKAPLEGPGSEMLFVPFGDNTNGNGSYSAGRYLNVPEPKGSSFVLDFNFNYNPLCNYSPAYNCPVPPRENILDVEIRAGELEYPHPE